MLDGPVMWNFDDAQKYPNAYFVVAFGDPRNRYETAELVSKFNVRWANLISPTEQFHPSNRLTKGIIVRVISI